MEEQEISLRELIEILLKNKLLISAITVFCILTSVVISFFVLDPVYESEAKILVSDLKKPPIKEEGIESIIDSTSNYPSFNVESYKEQMKNPEILNKVIKELKLDPEKYTINSLSDAITLETTKNTNIIKIKVKNKDPQIAADIANSLAKNFSQFVSEIAGKQFQKSLEYIQAQLDKEEKNLNKALEEYKKFLQQPQSVEELESENEAKINLLTQYKNELSRIDLDLITFKANLEEAEKQLVNTNKFIVTAKSIIDDSTISTYMQDVKNKDFKELAELRMESEEINPLYINLMNDINYTKLNIAKLEAKKAVLEEKISLTRKELETLHVKIAEKKNQLDILNRQVNNARKVYNALIDKNEEIRIAQSSKIGEDAIVVSSKAYPTEKPVSPKKALNVAIALVLGVMLGVFIAFFKEYWQTTSPDNKQSINI